MIDGGHLRALVRLAKLKYDADYIEKVAKACVEANEEIFRVLYYDCSRFAGTLTLPVSNNKKEFTAEDHWIHAIARKDLFAVRRGVLKFRGWKPKKTPIAPSQLTDDDFYRTSSRRGWT